MFWSLKCQKNLQDLLSGKYLKKTFVRHNAKNRIGETNFPILFTNMTLLTLLILAVCRMHVI